MDAPQIAQSVKHVKERIRLACERVGRDSDEVTVVAVSKTFPEETILAAHHVGLRDFGENKAQEFVRKYDQINPVIGGDVTWHFIGHLQRNKVKLVADRAHLIHGVDSLRLARTLQDFAEKEDAVIACLVEVNVSGEASKFGLEPAALSPFLKETRSYDRVSFKGLMTLASLTAGEERLRNQFSELRNHLYRSRSTIETMHWLSMGMSGDFEIAVEEGATHVRLGSILFGSRGA